MKIWKSLPLIVVMSFGSANNSSGADNPLGNLLGAILNEAAENLLEDQGAETADTSGSFPDVGSSVNLTGSQELTDNVAGALIAQSIYDKPADAVGGRCGSVFEVGAVEVKDRRIRGDTAQIEAVITVHPRVNAPAATIILCFGIMTNTGWRAGGSDVMVGSYDFELWDAGWRIAPRR